MLRQIALVALSAALSGVAIAQELRAIEPTWRVVARDGVSVRCGPETVFYAVAEYDQGRMLLVDGEIGNQARVRYPEDLSALVPSDEVNVVNDRTVELTRASALRAPSVLLGLSGSWKGLYDEELPAGTRLRVREAVKNSQGQVVGYRVEAPRPPAAPGHPRAFVPADALREATTEEIERHLSRVSAEPEPQPEPTGGADERPSDADGDDPDAEPVANQPEPADEGADEAEPAAGAFVGEGSVPEGATDVEPATGPDAEPAPRAMRASALEDLEASFEAARGLPPAELDTALDELLAEFSRTRAEAGDDERLAAQLDVRIEWLKLRIATREQRRAIAAALDTATERSRALESQVAEWRQGRSFALVGRLVVSTVYNGERLPRMYRVQTVHPVDGAVRTLGYVTPTPEIEQKLGRVVGVAGEPRFDPQLRLVIIRPDQIDVMPE